MINLLKNEIFKIFKKKGIWIILIILFVYTIFINFINKRIEIENNTYHDGYIKILKEELKNIDVNTDLYLYIDILNQIENYEFLKNYDKDSWQYYIANQSAYNYISIINNIKYTDNDKKELERANKNFDLFKDRLKGTWEEYTTKEMKRLEEEYSNYKEMDEYKELELRLKYGIPYGNNKLNNALTSYITNSNNLETIKKK